MVSQGPGFRDEGVGCYRRFILGSGCCIPDSLLNARAVLERNAYIYSSLGVLHFRLSAQLA